MFIRFFIVVLSKTRRNNATERGWTMLRQVIRLDRRERERLAGRNERMRGDKNPSGGQRTAPGHANQ